MAGISTEYLAEQIEAINERFTKALDRLTSKVEEGQKEFSQFRLDLTRQLAAIETSLAWAKGITALIVIPIVIGLAAYSYKAADRAARIEESIEQLRDHAKEQDARIAKLIEMREQANKDKPPAVPPTINTVPPGSGKTSARSTGKNIQLNENGPVGFHHPGSDGIDTSEEQAYWRLSQTTSGIMPLYTYALRNQPYTIRRRRGPLFDH